MLWLFSGGSGLYESDPSSDDRAMTSKFGLLSVEGLDISVRAGDEAGKVSSCLTRGIEFDGPWTGWKGGLDGYCLKDEVSIGGTGTDPTVVSKCPAADRKWLDDD